MARLLNRDGVRILRSGVEEDNIRQSNRVYSVRSKNSYAILVHQNVDDRDGLYLTSLRVAPSVSDAIDVGHIVGFCGKAVRRRLQ